MLARIFSEWLKVDSRPESPFRFLFTGGLQTNNVPRDDTSQQYRSTCRLYDYPEFLHCTEY